MAGETQSSIHDAGLDEYFESEVKKYVAPHYDEDVRIFMVDDITPDEWWDYNGIYKHPMRRDEIVGGENKEGIFFSRKFVQECYDPAPKTGRRFTFASFLCEHFFWE
ncbi:MAG: hypothetical protein LBC63_09095 [Holophagales bacterium]|jgi:hypothetical protein|nr:hypothetical protein [Holophagales bacterium]